MKTTFEHRGAKQAFESLAALCVAPLAASYRARRQLIGDERAYLELSERAARWPGIRGERMRAALHVRMGTPIGEAALLRFGAILERPPLSVGRMSVIAHYANVQHAAIGEDCLIGDNVVITDGTRQHSFERLDVPINAQGGVVRQIRIGNDCLIGPNSTIMADVGNHCVVGAGSVVHRPVPDYMIVAGNPARVIGDRRERGVRPLHSGMTG